MTELEQIKHDILTLAIVIRDLTCMVGNGRDKFIEDRLTLIHGEMREIINRT
jgi:hypothetical protein